MEKICKKKNKKKSRKQSKRKQKKSKYFCFCLSLVARCSVCNRSKSPDQKKGTERNKAKTKKFPLLSPFLFLFYCISL